MNPELEQAIKERIDLGHNKEQITAELRAAGYDDTTIEHVYSSVANGVPTTAIPAVTMPSVMELFKNSWSFTKAHISLVAVAAVPIFVMGMIDVLMNDETMTITVGLLIALVIGYVITLGLQLLIQLVVIHNAVHHQTGTQISSSASWSWGLAHFLSALWLYALVYAVVFGGMLLFIIPGLIAGFYLMFSFYTFVDEGLTGMAALRRSHQLIRGNVWSVFSKLVLFVVLVILIGFGAGLLAGFIAAAVGMSVEGGLLSMLINAVATGFFAVFGVGFMAALYQAVKLRASATPVSGTYIKVFGSIGAVATAGLIILMGTVMVMAFDELRENGFDFDALTETVATDISTDELSPAQQAELEAAMERIRSDINEQLAN